ncbi:hypothetical protein LTR56_016029 [Elasticomyces elasticus]|nr:hypothetical protein LTR56_016029 [Elasticomyces elasticus]KAK3642475.1 hypothetical protein LTR22_016109 [Elasticomyces elasticus]KAK4926958.1 hypothetical protein LTR49_006115 [Elasticomyces elasticus]KAK5764286.1 hypothetical protein LTS12_005499 [Elasticomyces elasticus]
MPRHEYSVVRGRPLNQRRTASNYGQFGPQPVSMQHIYALFGQPGSGYLGPQRPLVEGHKVSAYEDTPYPVLEPDLVMLQDESVSRHTPGWRPYPSPMSRDSALRLLKDGPRMTNEHVQAIERINTAVYLMGYNGYDLPIKMFNDLDLLFFQGQLKDRVTLMWSNYSVTRTREPFGSAYGLTWPAGANGNARVNIRLNATCDWTDLGGMQECLFTLLHEMVHAWYMVQCGRHDEGPDPPSEITTGLLDGHHGHYFHSAKEAINKIIQTLRSDMSRGRVSEYC